MTTTIPIIKSKEKTYEFGGALGASLIIVFSHLLLYYLWISLSYFKGGLVYPASLNEVGAFCSQMWGYISYGALPTLPGAAIYLGFLAFQAVLAWVMPGIKIKGLPIPTEGNRQLSYLCNGIGCWYVTLVTAFILHYTRIFRLSTFADHLGSMVTVSIITANVLSLILYLNAMLSKKASTPTGNVIYDFFMGVTLNPRVGRIDLKMFSEIRLPWLLLFFLTLSAAFKQYEIYGYISLPMAFMIVAHGLYANACMKGEECIPTTWDIFHEKFGWMLIFWNYAGVPFFYCFQSYYILVNNPEHSAPYMWVLFIVLLVAYYVWDTANSQKNRFRMQQRGNFVERRTFPQLPWGTLKNPKCLETSNGKQLLVDGWYRYARKIHYTADTTMALTWGLSCGVCSFLPFLYPLFFVGMIVHRYNRDMNLCAKKYGADWERYCKTVRYRFIPYIF